jgi:hypothetical protein
MTEAEWLTCTRPWPMLKFLYDRRKASGRQLRLFRIACCRDLWSWLKDADRSAIETAQLWAEGRTVDPEQLARADTIMAHVAEAVACSRERPAECSRQAKLLHDILGNPFCPVSIDPAWLTSNVTALAQTIYDERAFERMPILGDALEDAGCTNADILEHCRSGGEHVRGCWVVDLVLGRSHY